MNNNSYVLLCTIFLLLGCQEKDENTLFVFKDFSETGIDFQNNLSENVDFNLFNYYNYYNGAGVAIGDINNDGLSDIYFTSNLENNKLFLNKGGLQFEDISNQAKVTGDSKWTTGVTMVDINADGLLDIYVCGLGDLTSGKDRNELFLNNGDLTFTESAADYGLDVKSNATQASFFDYDNDGDLDMYLLNHSMTTVNSYASREKMLKLTDHKVGDRLFRNESEKGIKEFIDVTAAAGILNTPIGFGLGVGCSDINQDGFIDIYVSNDFHENDYLYINQKDGTFVESLAQWVGHTSKYSMGNDIADFNNDGLLDIVTMDMLPYDPEVLQKSMGEDPFELREIILKNGYHPQLSRNNLQLNLDGKFSEIAPLAGIHATDWSWAPLIVDLDNDGLKDIFISNGIFRRPNDLDYLNYAANGVIKSVIDIKAKSIVEKLIKSIPQYPISNFVFQNTGALGFSNKTVEWGLDRLSYSNGASYADLDNDGDLDLVVNNINEKAFLLENTTSQNKKENTYLKLSFKGQAPNINGVGVKVIIKDNGRTFYQQHALSRGFMSSVDNNLFFGLGVEKEIDSLHVIWSSGASQLLTKVAVNRTLEVKESEATGNYYKERAANSPKNNAIFNREKTILLEYTHEEDNFQDIDVEYLIPKKLSTEGPGIAVGDMNGDGLDDFFVTNAKNSSDQMFFQQPSGGFLETNKTLFEKDSIHEGVNAVLFDADGDNDMDLYVASGGNEAKSGDILLADRLYLNNGKGIFKRASNSLPIIFENTSCVKPADFDNDGDMDLFVGSRSISGKYGSTPESYILENNGSGYFEKLTLADEISHLGMVTDALWTDFDNDGWLDLAVVGEWMPITFIKNNNGSISNENIIELKNTNGWWNSLVSEDFDNDGDIDFMVGNVGLNTGWHTNAEEPIKLYIKDFDGNGSTDQIITYHSGGKEYPFATKDQLGKQLNFLKKKFTSYSSFSGVNIEKLLEPKQIENAEVKVASVFQSIYIENQEDNGFIIHSLPIEANFSTIMSMVMKDFNQDGLMDVIVAGNFYGFNPGMGRQDASYGTLLLNMGKNTFKPMSYEKSGIRIDGQVRNMKWINMADGTIDLILVKNNEGIELLKLEDNL